MRIFAYGLIVCNSFLGCGQPTANSEDIARYEISLNRPFEKGDQFQQHTDASVTISNSAYNDSRTLQDQTDVGTVKLHLDVTIESVSAKGQATRIRYTVKSMEGTVNRAPASPIPSGTIITAEAIGSEITRRGIPDDTHPIIVQLLENVLSAERDRDQTTQDGFGPPGPVDVGDSWDINADVAKEVLGSSADMFDVSTTITGHCNLDNVYELENEQIAHVAMYMEARNLSLDLPPEMNVEESSVTMSMKDELPLDPTKPSIGQTMIFTMMLKASGRGVTIARNVVAETTNEYIYP